MHSPCPADRPRRRARRLASASRPPSPPTPKGLALRPTWPTPAGGAACSRGVRSSPPRPAPPERPSHARLPPQPHKHCPLPLTRHHAHYVDEVGHRDRCRDVGPHAGGAVIAEARPRGSRTPRASLQQLLRPAAAPRRRSLSTRADRRPQNTLPTAAAKDRLPRPTRHWRLSVVRAAGGLGLDADRTPRPSSLLIGHQ